MIETIRHHLPQGITLDCRACGAPGKPLLLFVHGFPEGAFIWDGVMTPFSDRWRCVAPDLRGYGDSALKPGVAELPDHSQHSKRAMAADVVAVLDALGAFLALLGLGVVALLPFVDFELVPFACAWLLRLCADVGLRGFKCVVG